MSPSAQPRIGIIGLGYVGLPLAVEFGRHFDTVGFDINAQRVAELRGGSDHTLETSPEQLAAAARLRFSDAAADLRDRNVYVVTVPTPIDEAQRPDLRPLESACRLLGGLLAHGDLVVFESTVYPGTTEEVCVPILEAGSGLRFNVDFFCGYSPERINPGDHARRVVDIVKLTSGSTPEAAERVDALYRAIIRAGTHKTSSIRVAEAAKVIENVQRDVNIALVNELALIFHRLGIDTEEVLAAAGTKWNFLPFRPGLVGGHCIGVDPYYLTHKAEITGYHPELILAARRINSRMGTYVADRVIRLMSERRLHIVDARVLVLGFAFKENCPDLRNTRVIDIVRELESARARVDVYDPWVDAAEAAREYRVRPIAEIPAGAYDAVIVAVAHRQFREMGAARIRAFGKPGAVLYDVKSVLPQAAVDGRL
ncbi:nucleotide sugar dehydrogenase [Fulvimonas soli]|uniref:UDP-N-acetyl-D-galactosamine dehydrogenase n=1 Tax=Fulvimonas soli TaxID=155197 RepID=A0A316II49_9GAMM|nr:nucleotide sugar dehydrogenase [Fulvimonas soli]PWK92134.1 UDP-N-acetyl-D-galactosamine dehydrogenase [Fulvimonas soli]TNY27928.1 Vi polysaccharide biosynthesis protein VipA/TviB [Fulvimonas soli]